MDAQYAPIHLSESCPSHNIAVNSPAFDNWNEMASAKQCGRAQLLNVRNIKIK